MKLNPTLTPSLAEPYTGTLPVVAKTRGGAVFEPHADVWPLREGTRKFNAYFGHIPATEEFKTSFKAILVWYAQNVSLSHLKNVHYHTCELVGFKFAHSNVPVSEIRSADILNYKAAIGKKKEWYVGVLSGFFKKWSALGFVGMAADIIVLFDQLKLGGNEKGTAVATMNPVKGPFTNIELEALQQALNDAYAKQKVSNGQYVLCWLFMTLGQRPTQYAALKICDIYSISDKAGGESFVIRIPRAKERDSAPRGSFKERVLVPEVGRLVVKHAAAVREQFSELLPHPDDAPMFPVELDARIPVGFEYHPTASQVGNSLNSVLRRLKVVSERTGKKIHITPQRFRQTIGTRAAEEGHGELVIAELLDHTDTQNVGVYIRSTPAIVERIDKAVAMQMAPFAQAFAGKLIKDFSQASRKDDPSSVIRAPSITNSFDGMSSCGKHGFCGFMKPVACYICPSFEPWLDGPHERVLEFLLAERDRLLLTSGQRVASINDRSILAVAQVIQLCADVRTKRQESQ